MEYNGYMVGPVIRRLRQDRKLTLDQVSERTGLSISSIKQLEQGGRNMSMSSLYLFMAAYQCDANTILNIEQNTDDKSSIDRKLETLPAGKREYFTRTFLFMLEHTDKLML